MMFYGFYDQPPLSRAMWKVHEHLAERKDISIDAELAEGIARTAIAEYLNVLADQSTVETGNSERAGSLWSARAFYKKDLIRLAGQASESPHIGPCPPGKSEKPWGTKGDHELLEDFSREDAALTDTPPV